jgi:hypothetical protein
LSGLLARRLADLITLGRAAGAMLLAASGLAGRPAPLPLAAAFLLADWTGDILDGALARRAPRAAPTRIGPYDLQVDLWVAACLLVYLAFAGRLGLGPALAYLAGAGLLLAATGWPRALAMLSQAPVFFVFILVVFDASPALGLLLLGWPLAAVALTWPRFPNEVIPGFLAGLRGLWRNGPGAGRKV